MKLSSETTSAKRHLAAKHFVVKIDLCLREDVKLSDTFSLIYGRPSF